MQIIYVDTLFLLNSIVDYFLLLSAARVAGEPLARFRFFLGATLGGFYAVSIFYAPFLNTPLYKCLLCILILLVAYGKSRRLLRQSIIFLALSFAFAGGILALSFGGGEPLSLGSGVFYSTMDLKMVLLSAAVCYFFLTMVFQNFGSHSRLQGDLVSLVLTLGSKSINFTALVDTGNTLKDPITGNTVIVVEGELLAPFFPTTLSSQQLFHPTEYLSQLRTEHFANRLRLLPYQAVGVQGLLLVVKVDKILLNGSPLTGQLVALSPTPVCDGGNYHALVGANYH